MRALLLILVASSAFGQGRFDRFNKRCGQGRSSRGFACSSGVSLADAPQPGDLAGNWWAMYGDGTMRSGSAVTLVATGTPTNTTENGWPVRTYTAAQNDQEPANVAFPASDFSVCYHRRSVALLNVQIMGFGVGAAANTSALPLEQQVGGGFIGYISDGVAFAPGATSAAGVITAGQWILLCATYQRVGGAGNNILTIYANGVQVAQNTTMRLAQSFASVWSTNGVAGAVAGSAGSTRGVFVTYKLLSAADIARITGATAP